MWYVFYFLSLVSGGLAKCTQWSTFIDAYFKGYDVVYVEDISATTSPYYATQMVLYNADGQYLLLNIALYSQVNVANRFRGWIPSQLNQDSACFGEAV